MEPIESSEASAYINTLTPGTYPKEKKLQSKHGESLKSRIILSCVSAYLSAMIKMIKIFLIIKPTRCTSFSNLVFGMKLYMFRTVPLSIIRSFSLHTQQWYMSYKLCWHIPLLCVQWKTPEGGQRNCPKYVDFYSKNKYEKSVHLVGFIVRNQSRCTVTWTSKMNKICSLYSSGNFPGVSSSDAGEIPRRIQTTFWTRRKSQNYNDQNVFVNYWHVLVL